MSTHRRSTHPVVSPHNAVWLHRIRHNIVARFLTADDGHNNRNPILPGEPGYEDARFEECFVDPPPKARYSPMSSRFPPK